jgi:hypothetical protein
MNKYRDKYKMYTVEIICKPETHNWYYHRVGQVFETTLETLKNQPSFLVQAGYGIHPMHCKVIAEMVVVSHEEKVIPKIERPEN